MDPPLIKEDVKDEILIITFLYRFIHSSNRANKGYQLAVNHLADRTELEMKALRGKQKSTTTYNGGSPFPYDSKKMVEGLPSEFDWRLYGAVTPVKGNSCGLQPVTGSHEGVYLCHCCFVL